MESNRRKGFHVTPSMPSRTRRGQRHDSIFRILVQRCGSRCLFVPLSSTMIVLRFDRRRKSSVLWLPSTSANQDQITRFVHREPHWAAEKYTMKTSVDVEAGMTNLGWANMHTRHMQTSVDALFARSVVTRLVVSEPTCPSLDIPLQVSITLFSRCQLEIRPGSKHQYASCGTLQHNREYVPVLYSSC